MPTSFDPIIVLVEVHFKKSKSVGKCIYKDAYHHTEEYTCEMGSNFKFQQ